MGYPCCFYLNKRFLLCKNLFYVLKNCFKYSEILEKPFYGFFFFPLWLYEVTYECDICEYTYVCFIGICEYTCVYYIIHTTRFI